MMARERGNGKKSGGEWILVLILAILIAGLSVFLYPTVSDRLNVYRQSQVITEYVDTVKAKGSEESDALFAAAEEYNRRLLNGTGDLTLSEEQKEEYDSLLNVSGSGVMGYVSIPKIDLSLPIYHGTSEKVLQDAIGHLEGTSLPVGGKGTHTVISGHRGLPTARLFTDIDQLEEGDRFFLQILDRTFGYEVDQITVVLPDELNDLAIDPEEDYCTLLTCTPYGVNTHRLLVRGSRIQDTEQEAAAVPAPEVKKMSLIAAVAPLAVPGIAILAVIILLIIRAAAKRRRGRPQGAAR